jgi:hypothetical protein
MPEEQQVQDPPAPSAKSRSKPAEGDLAARIKELEQLADRERTQREDFQRQEMAALEERLGNEQVERARAQARHQFPNADQELLSEYPSRDPEVILAYAQKLHDKAQYRMLSANGVPLPPSNQAEAGLSTEEAQVRRWQTQIRNNHLRKTMDPIEAEQAFEVFFSKAWNQHMQDRKRLSGMYVPGSSTQQ